MSVMRETSDPIEKGGDGSSPSEAHCRGWEGLGKDGGNREMLPLSLSLQDIKIPFSIISSENPEIYDLVFSHE